MRNDPTAKGWTFLVTELNPPATSMGSSGRLATLPPHGYFSRNRDIGTPTAMGSGGRVQQPSAGGCVGRIKNRGLSLFCPSSEHNSL